MQFIGIVLVTDDVDRLVEFYKRILQVEFVGDSIHSEAKVDGAGLAIYSQKASQEQLKWSDITPSRGGNVTLLFTVDNVDDKYEEIKDFVPRVLTTPKTYPWGARAFHVLDPDGNIVDFVKPGYVSGS